MKSFIVFALFVAAAAALPLSTDSKDATIVSYENDNIGTDGFRFGFKTSDGTSADSVGVLKNADTDNAALEVRGAFSYIGPDGVTYSVTYIANEDGFQPQAAHLPVGPQ